MLANASQPRSVRLCRPSPRARYGERAGWRMLGNKQHPSTTTLSFHTPSSTKGCLGIPSASGVKTTKKNTPRGTPRSSAWAPAHASDSAVDAQIIATKQHPRAAVCASSLAPSWQAPTSLASFGAHSLRRRFRTPATVCVPLPVNPHTHTHARVACRRLRPSSHVAPLRPTLGTACAGHRGCLAAQRPESLHLPRQR